VNQNPISRQPLSVTVFTVATNRYLDYWKEMALSADRFLFPSSEVTLCVFTDRFDEASAFAETVSRVSIHVTKIEPLGWPEATLLRYALISSAQECHSSQVLMHLDADMLFEHTVGNELDFRTWINGIALVKHPSFYRTNRSYLRLLSHPRMLLSEFRNRISEGGSFGSWEHDLDSLAYVPKDLRRNYVCGGVWMGRATEFVGLVGLLADRVSEDSRNGIVAKWHDESHLNWFFAHNETTLLPPEYCSTDDTSWLHSLQRKIIAIDKGSDRSR